MTKVSTFTNVFKNILIYGVSIFVFLILAYAVFPALIHILTDQLGPDAAEQLNLKTKNCIVVEDSIQGIKAGKAAGCTVIALEGSIEKSLLRDADYIISHLSDIANIL